MLSAKRGRQAFIVNGYTLLSKSLPGFKITVEASLLFHFVAFFGLKLLKLVKRLYRVAFTRSEYISGF